MIFTGHKSPNESVVYTQSLRTAHVHDCVSAEVLAVVT